MMQTGRKDSDWPLTFYTSGIVKRHSISQRNECKFYFHAQAASRKDLIRYALTSLFLYPAQMIVRMDRCASAPPAWLLPPGPRYALLSGSPALARRRPPAAL